MVAPYGGSVASVVGSRRRLRSSSAGLGCPRAVAPPASSPSPSYNIGFHGGVCGVSLVLPGGDCLLQCAGREARPARKFNSAAPPSCKCAPAPAPTAMDLCPLLCPWPFGVGWRDSGPSMLQELRLLPPPLARRRHSGYGPGGPDLRSSPDPGSPALPPPLHLLCRLSLRPDAQPRPSLHLAHPSARSVARAFSGS